MCRLLGFAAPTPRTVVDVLGEEQTDRFQQMARLHDDGWGSLRRSADHSLRRVRTADSGHDNELLRDDLRTAESDATIVHLRLATGEMTVGETNTHPFVHGNVGMAHNGSIVPPEHLRSMVGHEALADVDGSTDSELYFALVRQHMDRGATPGQALARTIRDLREHYPAASLNAMLLSPDTLCVVRDSAEATPPWDDFVASGLADDELPLNHCDAYFRMHYRRFDDGTCAFSSVGLIFDDWQELADAHMASVDLATLELTIQPVAEVAAG